MTISWYYRGLHKHEQMTLITSVGQEDVEAAIAQQQHLFGFIMLDWNHNSASLKGELDSGK